MPGARAENTDAPQRRIPIRKVPRRCSEHHRGADLREQADMVQLRHGGGRGAHIPDGWSSGRDQYGGVRPSVAGVLSLIDTTDPAWPAVAAVLQEFTGAGIDLDATSAAMAVKLGKRRHAAEERRAEDEQPTLVSAGSIVYYIRRAHLIKIGTTVAPHSRFADLLPDEILAIEPGARKEETRRHRQFHHLRCGGEYFRDAPELRDHMARLRRLHGEPDPSWPTIAVVSQPRAQSWQPALAVSTETMTVREAVRELGIKENTIHAWAHRGRLQVAGRDEHRRRLFYVEHLIALRDSARSRMSARPLVKATVGVQH